MKRRLNDFRLKEAAQKQFKEVQTLQGHTSYVTSVAWNHDGSKIVSGSSDKTVKVWDAVSGRGLLQTLKGHTSTVTSVAFNHDGSNNLDFNPYRLDRVVK